MAIDTLGRLTPEFSAAIAGSFHLVILLAKIPAMTAAFSLRVVTPERLYSRAIPPVAQGVCTVAPFGWRAEFCAAVRGTSVAPKVTVPSVSWVMPAPDPTLW